MRVLIINDMNGDVQWGLKSSEWEAKTSRWILHDVSAGWFRQQLAFSVPICPRGNLPRCLSHPHVPTNGRADQSFTYQLELRLSGLHTELFPLLLMIFLIRRKEARARGLFFDLLSLNVERLPEPAFVRSGWHTQHIHTRTRTAPRPSYAPRWTCWPRHQLLWIGLIKSRADPLSTAWENPQQSGNVRIFAASVSSSVPSHPQLMY